ncbi:Protocadherin-11 X-linked [Echinococcus granulosus]|uniref:Protocadherin X n=1 Tax=Echinococcus granulosus TaxID=6210 RepID=A0A068WE25_ECHGR|nr:Protocadherin-11 X-linked [Echinococcus granulosus]CDS15866.1 protocadherin X [Echinococcus granulosus]
MLVSNVIFLAYLFETVGTTVGFNVNGEHGISVSFSLDEELPIGTLIGSLADKLSPRISTSSGVQFTPLGQERYIRLNQSSGQLFVRSRIDREALCEQMGTCCDSSSEPTSAFTHTFESNDPSFACALRLLVIGQRDPNPSSQPELVYITFKIMDVNDNPPKWSPDSLEIEIPEHSPIGTTILLPEATDPDLSIESAPIRYELLPQVEVSSDSLNYESCSIDDLFILSIASTDHAYGEMQRLNLQLKVNCDLDRERRDSYRLLLIAIDGSNKGAAFGDRTGTLNIIVKVTDINDQAPFFPESHPSIEISEDVAPGTQIFAMTAKDNDPSDASRLIYSYASTASGEVMRLFSICEKTGAITVVQDLDYEVAPLLPEVRSLTSIYTVQSRKGWDVGYIIPVKVTDGVHFAQTDLRIQLKNVNDNAPNITVHSHLPRWCNTNDLLLPEDAAVGTMIATINIEDADERWRDKKGGSSYSDAHCVTAHPFFVVQPLFPGARYQYMLVTSRRLDREAKNAHTVTIACHDSGQPVLSRGVHVVIHLDDLNDSPPVFTQSRYHLKISENLPVNTIIGKVKATDADTGLNGAVRYLIKEKNDLQELIKLDPVSGQIYTAAIFDREKMESINFTVVAMDCAGGGANKSENGKSCNPIHSASTTVIITIDDINDCVPEFDQSNYEFVVKEGQRPQQSIGSVHANDNDAGAKNSRVQYSISEPDHPQSPHFGSEITDEYRPGSLFAITSNGEIYTRTLPIDREKTPILSFTVVAADYGHPSLSAFANVVVRVQDVNDHTPVWIFPQSSNSIIVQVNMSSDATVGKEIAHLKAVDLDSGVNGEIEYSIIKGNEKEYFALDKASGTLYLAKPLVNKLKSTMIESNETESFFLNTSKEFPPKSFVLALKASDKGKKPRSNTTILKIDIIQNESADGSLSQLTHFKGLGRHTSNFSFRHGVGAVGDRDLLIITAMIVVALIISFVLITAIVFLRCRQPIRRRQDILVYGNNCDGRLIKRLKFLNCLNGVEVTTEKKSQQTAAFILTNTERNPNFEEHSPNQHYSSNNETSMHGALQMLHREDDIYGGFPSAVLLAPSTLTNGRKLPIIATSSEGTPIGYIITPNPTNADSKFVANETTVQKQQIGSDDASSSSTGHVKSTCNGLLYRLPDGGYAKVEKNYMTINPKLYQQSIYRKLHVHEEWNGPITQANNAQEDNHGIKKKHWGHTTHKYTRKLTSTHHNEYGASLNLDT